MEPIQFHNYLRLVIISNDHGGAKLREIFRDRYRLLTGDPWIDGSPASLIFYKREGQRTFQKSQKLQKEMLKTGDLNQWDCALLAEVLRNTNFTAKLLANKAEFEALHKTENDLIENLVKIRKKIAHLPNKAVKASEFTTLWDAASSALEALGVSVEDIDHVRSSKDIHGIQFLSVSGSFNQANIEKANVLREQGNKVVKNRQNFEKAIGLYTDALQLFELRQMDRGTLHSNRSAAYLMLLDSKKDNSSNDEDKNQELLKHALDDAKEAISLRPCWWKSYYRLGKVLGFDKQWDDAICAFNCALFLNESDVDLIRQEIDKCNVGSLRVRTQDQLDPMRLPYDLSEVFEKSRFKEFGLRTVPGEIIQMYTSHLALDNNPELQADARAFFARRYMEGCDGYERDYKKALELFTQAGSAGNAVGLFNVGLFYCKGYGVPQDVTLAVLYYRKAANCTVTPYNIDGIRGAQHALGICYELGITVPVDFKEAIKWHKRAVESGTGLGANNLAVMHLEGRGVEICPERFVQYLKLASVKGEVFSMETLAEYYSLIGNEKQAQLWKFQSLQAGSVRSHLNYKKISNEGGEYLRESSKTPQSPAARRSLQASNPMRVDVVCHHRAYQPKLEDFVELLQISTAPPQANPRQKSPTPLDGLKEITFEDMQLTIDHLYEGHIIHLTILENPNFNHPSSIMLNVMDKNGDFMGCNLYKLDKNDKELRRYLEFGSKLSILNPNHRLTAERRPAIRVYEPSSIIFEAVSNEAKNICRFCWKPNPKNYCGKCRRVKYCGRECQEQDWKLLRHKLICKPQT